MASITLAGTLLDPNSDLSVGDELRFTHDSTTGQTLKGAVSKLIIGQDGAYSLPLQYGLVLVEYKDSRSTQFKNLGVATVNGDNPATTIPELLNALVPVSSADLIAFQTILADAVTAESGAVTAKNAAVVAQASAETAQAAAVAAAASVENVLYIRHTKLLDKITKCTSATIPQGFCIGNSIMQGTGSSSINNTIPFILGPKLQVYTGVGSNNDWSPTNRSVGGSTSSLTLQYISDNADNGTILPENGTFTTDKDYCLILTMRNDVTVFSASPVSSVSNLIRTMLQKLKSKNIDPIFITDVPKVDMSTGDIIDTQSNWGKWYDQYISICAAEGVTVVDAWKYFDNLKSQGVDIRTYSYDGVHPNDAGYEVISELIFKSMTGKAISYPVKNKAVASFDYADSVSVYDAAGGSVTTTTTITGLNTGGTARKQQTGEATTEAFVLSDGDTIEFTSPAPTQGIVIDMLGGVSGTLNATYGSVNLTGGIAAESGSVRETATLRRLVSGVVPYDSKSNIVLTSVGTTRVLGVTFLCEKVSSSFARWIDVVETGTWTDTTFSVGGDCNESSTVGDSAVMSVYGSMLSLNYERRTGNGKFSYSIDGAAAVEIDTYLNASPVNQEIDLDLGFEGFHKITFIITTKNASSTGNRVRIGNFRKYLGQGDQPVDYIAMNASDVVNTRTQYNNAETAKVISGTNAAYDGLSDGSITLSGTGAALVKLTF